jgi:pimeloyl-ACP methyl ester carboxylesterase
MQHGLISLADTWIYNTPELAPAFQLAREGYDIWLGNNRGNVYSLGHTSMVPDASSDYFNYSFQKLGQYDLPAQIDMVKQKTGVSKVTYMGHSQGTSQMFYALSKFPNEISSRVNLFVACAPVTRMANADPSLKNVAG